MAKVIVYTKDPCPYCVRAIQLLSNKGVEFEEIDLTGNLDELVRLKEQTGWMTVPIIMINGELIGGYTELKALNDEGRLDEVLRQ